uniref:Uncharacterized protein n=1 Tax=Caenorhabditis japonica TaxID=281687 RepID=A0A8R1EG94_CAEJA
MFAQASPKPRPTSAPFLARLRSFKSSPTLAQASPIHLRIALARATRPNVCPLAAKNYVRNNSVPTGL